MNDRQIAKAREQYIISKVFGGEPTIWESNFESDRRKLGKALRQAVEAGYASQTGKNFVWTDKAYNEIEAIAPALIERWEKSRDHGWNYRRNLAMVLFNTLEQGEQRWILDNAGLYDWYLLDDQFIQYTSGDVTEKDLFGPMKLEEVGPKRKELGDGAGSGRYKTYSVLVTNDTLVAHAQRTLEKERFDGLYKINLKWGLQQLGIVADEDSDIAKQLLKEEEGLGILCGGGGGYGLPPNPDHWTEQAVDTRIEMLQNALEMAQKRLEFMKALKERIEAAGGWATVKERYAERMRQEIANLPPDKK